MAEALKFGMSAKEIAELWEEKIANTRARLQELDLPIDTPDRTQKADALYARVALAEVLEVSNQRLATDILNALKESLR